MLCFHLMRLREPEPMGCQILSPLVLLMRLYLGHQRASRHSSPVSPVLLAPEQPPVRLAP